MNSILPGGKEPEDKKPILIYKGEDICYNILNVFAEQFGRALEELGETVEYYDLKKADLSGIGQYAGREFKAIVGFQTYVFDIYLSQSGRYLHELIHGPKFNFQFDHPVWMKHHYENLPEDCYILTHDRNYKEFIEKYYPKVKDTFLLPPGGMAYSGAGDEKTAEKLAEKPYEMVFVGTYSDYREYEKLIEQSEPETGELARNFYERMKENPGETAEVSLQWTLKNRNVSCSDEQFLNILDALKPMIYGVMSYYREHVVETLLEGGIELEVYGDSWKNSPFAGKNNLHIHEAVSVEESLLELSKSRFSLNIMAWHKDGFTERIANSMRNHSVVVSDRSRYLEERFADESCMILFDLKDMCQLPQKVRDTGKEAERMAARAYALAEAEDTWEDRAVQFQKILKQIKNSSLVVR